MKISKNKKALMVEELRKKYKNKKTREKTIQTIDKIVEDRKIKIENYKYEIHNLRSNFSNAIIILLTFLNVLITLLNIFINELKEFLLTYKFLFCFLILLTMSIHIFFINKKFKKGKIKLDNDISEMKKDIDDMIGIFLKDR